jgi:hypothetical protein
MTSTRNRDLIDHIANELPENLREPFYREMVYCRTLPESDEMLRILRAMQILTLLMVQVPERIIAERKRMQELLATCLEQFAKSFQAGEASRLQLDQKLDQLPRFIAAGITSKAIVTEINSRLEEQFSSSTIPQLLDRLTETAAKISTTVTVVNSSMDQLRKSYEKTELKAREALGSINSAIHSAANTAAGEAERLSQGFHQQYWWSIFLLTSVALFIGIIAGMWFTHT